MHLTHSVDEVKSESLSAAQSDYLNQLTQKTADCLSTVSGQSSFLSVINSQVRIEESFYFIFISY